MTTQEIADKLVANCRKGDFEANYNELFAEDVKSRETSSTPLDEVESTGLAAIRAKAAKFHDLIEKVRSRAVSDPLVAGNAIAFTITQEFDLKGTGPLKLDELCLFRVKDGKIVYEEYFYEI